MQNKLSVTQNKVSLSVGLVAKRGREGRALDDDDVS
jgi:hypothetical protein